MFNLKLLHVTVIYVCIHFLLAHVEGLSYKPKYWANIFHYFFYLFLLSFRSAREGFPECVY